MQFENLKIVALEVENFKRIAAVHIRPDGNLVQITGRNGQGKSSVLDAIWMAIEYKAGSREMPAPIKTGESFARILVDLGEIVIKRNFTAELDDAGNPTSDYTTKLYVEAASGARFPSPQTMLDALFGTLSFDPLEFTRMDSKKQFDTLRGFVPHFDFEKFKRDHDEDYARRTKFNQLADQERGAAGVIVVPKDTPTELIDIDALITKLKEAGELNLNIERREANRREAATTIQAYKDEIANADTRITDAIGSLRSNADSQIQLLQIQMRQLQIQIDGIKAETVKAVCATTERHEQWLKERRAETEQLEAELKSAEPLPERVDTEAILAEIEEARKVNLNVAKYLDKRVHEVQARRYEEEAKNLTAQITKRIDEKNAAIAASSIPVEGLGFGDDQILLRGVPFSQGSDAERLRASVQIAIAMNPKLRVIRIRDGSLLDENGLALICEMAEADNMQIWIERVDSSGAIGFVIQDGRLKDAAQ